MSKLTNLNANDERRIERLRKFLDGKDRVTMDEIWNDCFSLHKAIEPISPKDVLEIKRWIGRYVAYIGDWKLEHDMKKGKRVSVYYHKTSERYTWGLGLLK